MTDWDGMRATVIRSLDNQAAGGWRMPGDDSMVVDGLLRLDAELRGRATRERWAISEMGDCVAAWRRGRGGALPADAHRAPELEPLAPAPGIKQGRLL